MTNIPVAIYARVSSDQQTEAPTSASQLAALRARVAADGFTPVIPGHAAREDPNGPALPSVDQSANSLTFSSRTGLVVPALWVRDPH